LNENIMITTLPKDFYMRPASMADIPITVDLFNTCSQHYLGVRDFNIEFTTTDWSTPKFKPEDDIRLVFSPREKLVGYIEVWTVSNPPIRPWIWGRTHPEYERQGIGTALMLWAEERSRQEIQRCPSDARVIMHVSTPDKIESAKYLFEKLDMRLFRHGFRMQIDMKEPPPKAVWPAGITVRNPVDKESEIEAIFRAEKEAFQDHFGYVDVPYEEGLADFKHWFLEEEGYDDDSLWFLALDGGEIAGLCLCRKQDLEDLACGYVNSLAVRRPWRKRGIGLALLQQAFGEYYRRGFSKVALGVDGENLTGALRLYKKAGMKIHRQYDRYEKVLRAGKELSVRNLET
jgi:ribosomal protein S18 acetylase RimI-like enzyme